MIIVNEILSQTDTYKGKNVGNGRQKRRSRFKEGKTY